jgi:hypothetical protein
VIRFTHVDDTVWPIDWSSEDEDSAQWVLRYGNLERREAQRLGVASILCAYATLLDPDLFMKTATEMLRRGRRAMTSVWNPEGP